MNVSLDPNNHHRMNQMREMRMRVVAMDERLRLVDKAKVDPVLVLPANRVVQFKVIILCSTQICIINH